MENTNLEYEDFKKAHMEFEPHWHVLTNFSSDLEEKYRTAIKQYCQIAPEAKFEIRDAVSYIKGRPINGHKSLWFYENQRVYCLSAFWEIYHNLK